MGLQDFRLEAYFARWEFTARYHLTASDAQTIGMADLLAMADPADLADWQNLTLGYTETRGDPKLREAIASTYDGLTADDILVFAGPGEGLTSTMRALLRQDDHAPIGQHSALAAVARQGVGRQGVVVPPNYQSAESVPASLCAITGLRCGRRTAGTWTRTRSRRRCDPVRS